MYQGNPVETTIPVTQSSIVDGTILQTDLSAGLSAKIDLVLTKQDELVSGTNIKTVNGNSFLGSGNLDLLSETVLIIGTSTSAVEFRTYVMTASLTLTFPASPVAGTWINVINRSATTSCVINRNGQNIMGLAEDFTVDIENFSGTFVFADATRGWVLI